MLKSELNELIKDIDDTKDIDEIILGNGFSKPITDIDSFNKLIESNKDFKKIFDGKITKSIENFKGSDMQKLIDAEVLKRTNKEESPLEKQIRELTERVEKADKEKAKAEMIAKYKDTLSEKNIPSKLIEFILGDDDETTNANIELFEDSMKSYIDGKVNTRLNGGYKPPKSDDSNVDPIKEQLNQIMGLQK